MILIGIVINVFFLKAIFTFSKTLKLNIQIFNITLEMHK
jgi:hypothetical protein